ncbi:MAG: tetratricopeptide repeat protein [Candidatus Obscuribacterales bacterium]|nr:tetratricopeptide repeat protein [Candidatus Obscuribacterales bacterium]
MASNTQIVANIHRGKRPGKRIWIGVLAAITLVTLPVLPLKFLGIPGPDLDWRQVEDLSKLFIGRITTWPTTPDKVVTEPATQTFPKDIKLVDATVRSLLNQLTKNPSDPGLHNRIGLIYAELGEPHSAITHFEESIKVSRERIKALTLQSKELLKKDEIDKASQCMLDISDINVQLAAAHSSLARVYEQLGKSDRVIAQLNELSKDISLSKVPKSQSVATRESSPAIQAGTTISANRLDSETAALLARADALRQAGRNLEAMQEYKRLSMRLPNFALVHKELGLTALSMRNVWMAQEELAKAAQLNTADATTHSALGSIYRELGQSDKATQEFEKALKYDPKEVSAAFSLGNLYADQGQYDKAIASFQRALTTRPDFALAHNNLATMYSFSGDYANAIREFRQAIALSPNMASAHYGLGIACLNEKHFGESARAFKRAIVLNPNLLDAHSKLEIAQKRMRNQPRID